MLISKEEVLKCFCNLCDTVRDVKFKNELPMDCFCGFNEIKDERFDSEILDFICNCIYEKIRYIKPKYHLNLKPKTPKNHEDNETEIIKENKKIFCLECKNFVWLSNKKYGCTIDKNRKCTPIDYEYDTNFHLEQNKNNDCEFFKRKKILNIF